MQIIITETDTGPVAVFTFDDEWISQTESYGDDSSDTIQEAEQPTIDDGPAMTDPQAVEQPLVADPREFYYDINYAADVGANGA